MNRSKIILIALGAVAIIVAGVFVNRAVSGFSASRAGMEERDRALADLEKVYKDEIFPSAANVGALKDDVARYGEVRDSFATALTNLNVRPPASRVTPSAFMQTLQTFVAKKIEKAPVNGGRESVAEDFAFGFDRYIGDPVMPSESDVPRLVQQLLITSKIVDALYAAGLVQLRAMTREVFETAAPRAPAPAQSDDSGPRSRLGRAGAQNAKPGPKGGKAPAMAPAEPLFVSQRFTVDFSAYEHSVIDFMNRLASLDCFAVVSDIQISKGQPDIRIPEENKDRSVDGEERPRREGRTSRRRRGDDSGEQAQPPPPPSPKQFTVAQRLMTGPDVDPPLDVKLTIDVYDFRAAQAGEGR